MKRGGYWIVAGVAVGCLLTDWWYGVVNWRADAIIVGGVWAILWWSGWRVRRANALPPEPPTTPEP